MLDSWRRSQPVHRWPRHQRGVVRGSSASVDADAHAAHAASNALQQLLIWSVVLLGLGCRVVIIRGVLVVFGVVAQVVRKLETFAQQTSDAALAFWDVAVDDKLAVLAHVVD
jgi:hypothetical protein